MTMEEMETHCRELERQFGGKYEVVVLGDKIYFVDSSRVITAQPGELLPCMENLKGTYYDL